MTTSRTRASQRRKDSFGSKRIASTIGLEKNPNIDWVSASGRFMAYVPSAICSWPFKAQLGGEGGETDHE